MATTEYRILLPKSLEVFVNEQLASGQFRDASEYFTALVEAAQAKREKLRLMKLAEEGIASGPATPMTSQDWQNLRERVQERLAQHPKSKP
jgi:antitoxin ParD1/3/4